jgi:hypothetical protein
MLRRRAGESARELVEAAKPIAEQAVTDEELRRSAAAALLTALRLRSKLLAPVGVGVLGTRLVYDRGVQEDVRRLAAELSAVRGRTRRAQARRRQQRLAGAAAGLGATAAAALLARRLKRASASREETDAERSDVEDAAARATAVP